MTKSIKERAREAQQEHFDEMKNPASDEVKAMSLAMYAAIDALTPEKRALLVNDALHQASSAIQMVGSATAGTGMEPILIAANAFVAIAGYAEEVNREERDETLTGDRAVTEVITLVKDMVTEQVETSMMTPEQREEAHQIKDRVKARVKAGEDFETVLEDETSKAEHFTDSVFAAKADDEPSTGLYL